MKVRKAVILAAGLNTRMFPVSKIIPKAALPMGEKPVIHLLIEECVKSGIKEVIIVVRKGDNLIKSYFSKDSVLEKMLIENKKPHYLKIVKKVEKLAKLKFVYQEKQLGEAYAVMLSKKFVSKEPFLVLYGDTLFERKNSGSKQVLEKFNKSKKHIFGAPGRFVFKPSFFKLIQQFDFKKRFFEKKRGLSLPEVFDELLEKEKYTTVKLRGNRFDIGSPKGYADAFLFFVVNQKK